MTRVVVVTGAAGFIGSHVCRGLVETGYHVVGVDNFDPFYGRAAKERAIAPLRAAPGFRLVEGDVRDRAVMDVVLRGAHAVVHLAARAGVRASVYAPHVYRAVNVGGSAAVLEACRTAGVRRLVVASSSSVYGASPVPFREATTPPAPQSPYATTKLAMEALVWCHAEADHAHAVILRFFSVYGPGQRPDQLIHQVVRAAVHGTPLERYGAAASARDYTHVRDVTRGVLAALRHTERPGRACVVANIGAGRAVSLDQVIRLVEGAVGRPVSQRLRDASPGDTPVTLADLAVARRTLGYAPRVPIERGIHDFVEWYEARHEGQCRAAS